MSATRSRTLTYTTGLVSLSSALVVVKPPLMGHLCTDHISSAATGHQRSEGRGPSSAHMSARHRKLAKQLPETSDTHVLRNVRVYINGYLDNTTDIEMKRIVTLAGGQITYVESMAFV